MGLAVRYDQATLSGAAGLLGAASLACEDGPGYAVASIAPRWLLEADFGDRGREEVSRALSDELLRLRRVEAGVQLELGWLLEHVNAQFDLRAFGHSSQAAFAEARLGCSAAKALQLRKLGRGLDELPILRESWLAGLVPFTGLLEVVKVATPFDEAGWAQLARSLSSRELKRMVAAVKAQAHAGSTDGEGDEASEALGTGADDERVRLAWRGTWADAATWEFAKEAVRKVSNERLTDEQVAEALAAEALATLGHAEGALDGLDESVAAQLTSEVARLRKRHLLAKVADQRPRGPKRGTLSRAARKLRKRLAKAQVVEAPPRKRLPRDPEGVLSVLDELVRRLRSLEWERARLLCWLEGRRLHVELGFESFHELTERRFGLAPKDVRHLVSLPMRLGAFGRLDAAWRAGELDSHSVRELLRVAEPQTESAWLELARSSTPRRLESAVSWSVAERGRGRGAVAAVPTPDQGIAALTLDALGRFGVTPRFRREDDLDTLDELRSTDLFARRLRRIGFTASESVATVWIEALKSVQRHVGEELPVARRVSWLARHFVDTHVTDEVLKHAREHGVMERDGWCCQVPHCHRRGPLHAHHVVYRSHGGSDDESNLITVCLGCHAMIHDGWIRIVGEAPGRLTFSLVKIGPGEHGEGRWAETYRLDQRVPRPAPLVA